MTQNAAADETVREVHLKHSVAVLDLSFRIDVKFRAGKADVGTFPAEARRHRPSLECDDVRRHRHAQNPPEVVDDALELLHDVLSPRAEQPVEIDLGVRGELGVPLVGVPPGECAEEGVRHQARRLLL